MIKIKACRIEIFNLWVFLENILKFKEMIEEEFLSFVIEYLINISIEDGNIKDKNTTEEKREYIIMIYPINKEIIDKLNNE